MFTRKKAQRWVLILLVCVLFIGLFSSTAYAASGSFWKYNGVELPALPLDYVSYPYACISKYNGSEADSVLYRLVFYDKISRISVGWGTTEITAPAGTQYKGYFIGRDDLTAWQYMERWSGTTTGTATFIMPVSGGQWSFVWSNVDLYNSDGNMVHSGSEPDQTVFPATPQFRVNLPKNYVYQYGMDELAAVLYVDAYITDDNGQLQYTWQKYVNGAWLDLEQYGHSFTPPTNVEGTYRYRCKVINEEGNYINASFSNAVYVMVGTSATLPGGETETISPGDQIIIDQIGDVGDTVTDIKDGIESLPGDITDGIQGVLDNEKTEAESTGNDLVGELTNVIPDIGEAGKQSLQPLIDAISWEGRNPVLTLPALVMPGIDGLWEETVLMPAQNIEFAGYVSMIPWAVRELVQALAMIGCVLYLIKDVYGLIQYFATLRGGHNE